MSVPRSGLYSSDVEFIKPDQTEVRESIPLTVLDMQYSVGGVIPLVWYFKESLDTGRLRTSLGTSLSAHPILAGRLSAKNKPASVELTGGVPFTVRKCDYREELDDHLQTLRSGSVRPVGSRGAPGDMFNWNHIDFAKLAVYDADTPLLTVQVCHFSKGGGSAIFLTVAHVVADTTSAMAFARDWAAAYRGETISQSPRLSDTAFTGGKCDESARLFEELQAVPKSTYNTNNAVLQKQWLSGEDVVMAKFTISASFKEALKQKANQELPSGKFASTNDALSAHVWRILCRLYGENKPNAATTLAMQVNCRKLAGMATEPFGNCITTCCSSMTVGDLNELSLSELALALRATLNGVCTEDLGARMKWLEHQQRRLDKKVMFQVDPNALKFYLSSWQCDYGGVAFGERPVWFDTSYVGPMTTILLYREDGSVDVLSSGTQEKMDAFLAVMGELAAGTLL